jgi:hypothetical protein
MYEVNFVLSSIIIKINFWANFHDLVEKKGLLLLQRIFCESIPKFATFPGKKCGVHHI